MTRVYQTFARNSRALKALACLLGTILLTISVFSAQFAYAAETKEVSSKTQVWTDEYEYHLSSNKEVTIDSRVEVYGNVTLTIEKGAKLTAKRGIHVIEGSTLNIEGSGELIATGYRG